MSSLRGSLTSGSEPTDPSKLSCCTKRRQEATAPARVREGMGPLEQVLRTCSYWVLTRLRITWSFFHQISLQTRKLIEEFDPGSERTLAVCLIHASRARKPGQLGEYSGGRVRNTWITYPPVGDNPPKGGLIPNNGGARHRVLLKAVRRWRSGPWPIS